jgi:dTDP-4-dehydrorhamnose reductase
MKLRSDIEIWGGLECTINRVNNNYFNQFDYSGHYNRESDIEAVANLGLKKLRYPVLWEKHKPQIDTEIDWAYTEKTLNAIREKHIDVIAGLLHHGSGPEYVHMLEDSFVQGLADYAAEVARKFPWIMYYTPVNEPLTTARFCGLYGIWFPHKRDNDSFCRILINECKATVLAMQAIRKINPDAKLVQTDDLGKIHSTPLLKYQADFENNRRWLSYDLLCGKVTQQHPLWKYLLNSGITKDDLQFFISNKCAPDVLGFNHYLTSERYLDENLDAYPAHTHGGNGKIKYADVEAVRVGHVCPDGPYKLLKEAWERYHLPMAVTEVHLYCTREEQMRWLNLAWETANKLKDEGADMLAITPWALLGSHGWNKLLTQPNGDYEPGVFDINNGKLRPTSLAGMISAYSNEGSYDHPVMDNNGWWQRECRVEYGNESFFNGIQKNNRPILIIGKNGTLGNAFARLCTLRGISYRILGHQDVDITNLHSVERCILDANPWAIVNTAGFVRVDDAEMEAGSCFAVNTYGPQNLAVLCEKYAVKLLTFSSDLVFDGIKQAPYTESDKLSPLNIYGQSKALAEQKVLEHNSSALIIRTAAFFGPWDKHNFAVLAISSLKKGISFTAVNDIVVSPTYVPDVVNASLDLMIDNESGIWNLSNKGELSWADFAYAIANGSGLKASLIDPKSAEELAYKAKRPAYSVLSSERGIILPSLENAIDRCIQQLT